MSFMFIGVAFHMAMGIAMISNPKLIDLKTDVKTPNALEWFFRYIHSDRFKYLP